MNWPGKNSRALPPVVPDCMQDLPLLPKPDTFKTVLDEEIKQVNRARGFRLAEGVVRPKTEESLVGLAFSGGGIRSATFNLGVLQALAKAKLLRTFDYISTVSGGGYIGSWLMAWMHREKKGIRQIEEHLSDEGTPPRLERPEIRFLRSYSNYLTPRKGLLGADFWAFVATYLRNTILNQAILVLLILAVLLVPRCILVGVHLLEVLEQRWGVRTGFWGEHAYSQYFAMALGMAAGLVAIFFIGLNLRALCPDKDKQFRWYTRQRQIHLCIVAPLIFSAGLISYGLGPFLKDYEILSHRFTLLPLLGVVLYGGPWLVTLVVRELFSSSDDDAEAGPASWIIGATAIITGALVSYLFIPLSRVLMSEVPWTGAMGVVYLNRRVLTWGTPTFVLVMLLAGVLHIGLMGREMRDGNREWWARLGACIGLYAVAWLALFLIAIYFPFAFWRIKEHGYAAHFTWTASLTWVGSTLYGVLFGKSEKTREALPDAPVRKKLLALLATAGAYVFILGLFLLVSMLGARIANLVSGYHGSIIGPLHDGTFYSSDLLAVQGAIILAVLALSWRVDVNEFSVHYLYRNRLVRCYLGASVEGRAEQPFTGFSDGDDVPLGELQIPINAKADVDDRPIPILNTSLNVVRGKELALQTRKARSFAITPLYAGFTKPVSGEMEVKAMFAATSKAGADRPDSKTGARLGTAMAISGAAASPNMGSYSAPALAFLMTLFDVRLGWWLANPKDNGKNWRSASPNVGFYWLLSELLGFTDDDSKYIYLSDGGHFENLGIYELVRRRCKVIVASDASCDSAYGFSDLHNAMERCRADFGIEIEMTGDESGRLRPVGEPPRATSHFAVGTIRYCPGKPECDGVLIYLKPALTQELPADVLGYSSRNSQFPNDTTANQWFDESHFENYRAMGEATGRAAMAHIHDEVVRVLGVVRHEPIAEKKAEPSSGLGLEPVGDVGGR